MYVCMYLCMYDIVCGIYYYYRQMLMDLDESRNLIGRFRQSDQLEKLDQLLHSWQSQGAPSVGGWVGGWVAAS